MITARTINLLIKAREVKTKEGKQFNTLSGALLNKNKDIVWFNIKGVKGYDFNPIIKKYDLLNNADFFIASVTGLKKEVTKNNETDKIYENNILFVNNLIFNDIQPDQVTEENQASFNFKQEFIRIQQEKLDKDLKEFLSE